MADMTGGEAIARTLLELGVSHVFGIVSVHNLPIYDAITRLGGIEPICARHEQNAVHMADGYARATGRLGVAIASTGPGCANAVAGLYEANAASSPVLLLTGQVETIYYGKGKGYLHEAENQLAMLRTVTRRADTVRVAEEIPSTVHAVVRDILTGRPAPGAVEIPIDLQYATVDHTIPAGFTPRPVVDEKALRRGAEVLGGAARPVIWAGSGVVASGGSDELVRLAERLGAPVVTSIEGRGAMPEDHPLSLGPRTDRRALAGVLGEADVLLAVGTRFFWQDTVNWNVRLPSRIVHIDADNSVLNRNYRAEVAVQGDAKRALQLLSDHLDTRSEGPPARCDAEFLARAQAAKADDDKVWEEQIGPDHWQIMDTLRSKLPRDAVIAKDTTLSAALWGNKLLPVLAPRTTMRPVAAAIGPGLPLALGAAVGVGKRTIVIHGDGGLMMSATELSTAAQHHVPLTTIVFNDGGYGVLRIIEESSFGRQNGVDLATPDFAAMAESMGVPGRKASGVDEFDKALEWAFGQAGPNVIDLDMRSLAPMQFQYGGKRWPTVGRS
ncbi:MAG: thiamine pyrophosphate-binding protein [Acidimicrobiales bacterium]